MPRILGIETSCDETAAAVVEDGRRILSNVVLSQVPVHRLYGGVVPELASREHLRGIVPVVRQALEQAGPVKLAELDAVAVTCGPGLAGALLVGLTYAKALALAARLPLLGVHHLEGHLHAVLLEQRRQERPDPPLPAVALVVSGGHTQLYRVERPDGVYRYRLLGQTRDDAAGEAYDKVAKLLALGYPGGPLLDRLAAWGDPQAVTFGRIRLKGNPLDFSFSGLKTAVVNTVRRRPDASDQDVAASFQQAVVDVLVAKAVRASIAVGARGVCLAGGVAANGVLRAGVADACAQLGVPAYLPSPAMCTDNAAMIAAAGWWQVEHMGPTSLDAGADPNLRLPLLA